jgi:hypothetical protein
VAFRNRSILAAGACVALGLLFLLTGGRLLQARRSVSKLAWDRCHGQALAAAGEVDRVLVTTADLVHGLASDLESGKIAPDGLSAALVRDLARAPKGVSRMGVMFEPYAAVPGRQLLAVSAARGPKGIPAAEPPDPTDYTKLPWYQIDLKQPNWNEPHMDPLSGDLLVDYSEPFRLPGSKAPSGVVRMEMTMREIQVMVAALAPGSSGYGFLLSDKGVYLSDPLESRVRNGVTFEAAARSLKDAGRIGLIPAVQANRPGFAVSRSAVTQQQTWFFIEPVRSARWTLGTVIITDELVLEPPGMNRTLVAVITLGLAFVLSLFHLLFGPGRPGGGMPWVYAVAASLTTAAATGVIWYAAYNLAAPPRPHEVEVMSKAARDAFLAPYERLGSGFKEVKAQFIPTGIFIQQLELSGDNRMAVTGQIWERFPKEIPREDRGITFPEALSLTFGEGFSRTEGEWETRVVPFRGVFQMQTDSTQTYPFDRTSVRLRIWAKHFYSAEVLVPDLESYTILVPASLPGFDKGLALSGWHLERSAFAFITTGYNTNFGIRDFNGQQDSPELAYKFTLKRNFTNPCIATFMPILVVAGLLFALVMTTTRNRERMGGTGYNAINILRAIVSLFFPVVLAQINLRNHILTEGLLLVEYYYFVFYLMILAVAINSLAVAHSDNPTLQYEDNRIAKLLFWPVLTLAFYAISVSYLL